MQNMEKSSVTEGFYSMDHLHYKHVTSNIRGQILKFFSYLLVTWENTCDIKSCHTEMNF